jgi:drug/metabolite transporter (DMT)-like permease
MTAALLLALVSSVGFGAADFSGGLAARGAHVLRVLVISTPASLLVAVIAWPLQGASFTAATMWWGVASGLASAAAFGLLYYTLAVGPMSVLSPITALVSAAVPAAVGLLIGERFSGLAVAGMVVALIAVIVVSTGSDAHGTRAGLTAVLLALGAGAAIAIQIICFDQAPHGSGDAPLLINRVVAAAVVIVAAAARRGHLGRRRPGWTASAAAGTLVACANLSFILAVRHGALAIVAVISALYPASTVLLARVFLGERIGRVQLAGLGLAALAVVMLAAR